VTSRVAGKARESCTFSSGRMLQINSAPRAWHISCAVIKNSLCRGARRPRLARFPAALPPSCDRVAASSAGDVVVRNVRIVRHQRLERLAVLSSPTSPTMRQTCARGSRALPRRCPCASSPTRANLIAASTASVPECTEIRAQPGDRHEFLFQLGATIVVEHFGTGDQRLAPAGPALRPPWDWHVPR